VADGGGVDSILRFQLKMGGDGTKCCRKMRWRQRACLGYIERKRDTTRWRDNVDWRRGGTGEEKGRRDAS
jgi:hypothetical protein